MNIERHEASPLKVEPEPVAAAAPFAIDGIGAYVTRDGRRVYVTSVDCEADCEHFYACGGSITRRPIGSSSKACGARMDHRWKRNGRFYLDNRETDYDIVGPWVEPVTTCERCKQLLAERDGLRGELIELKRLVLNAVTPEVAP